MDPSNRIDMEQETKPDESSLTLTERLVQLSERKMKLIRNLLSPEEYDSVALSLLPAASTDVSDGENLSSWGAPSTRAMDDEEQLSDSSPVIPIEPTERSLSASLARKREGNDFFFGADEDERIKSKENDLSIELRSGYNINYQSTDTEPVLMDKGFGSSSSLESEAEDHEKGALISCQVTSPYSTKHNLSLVRRRLEADKDLDKLLAGQSLEVKPLEPQLYSKELINTYTLFQSVKSSKLECNDSPIMKSYDKVKRPTNELGASLKIRVVSMIIREHPEFRDEERIASRLADCARELELIREISLKLCKKLLAKLQSILKRFADSKLNLQSKLLILINQLIQVNEKMESNQKELLNVYQELTSIRQVQECNFTTILVEQDEDSMKLFSEQASELEHLLSKWKAVDEGLEESLNTCLQSIKKANQKYVIKFDKRKQESQDQEEWKRRSSMKCWIDSLRLSLYSKEEVSSNLTCNSDNIFILNTNLSQFHLEDYHSDSRTLGVRLSCERRWTLPFMRRTQLVSQTNVQIKATCKMRHSINLECDEGGIVIQLVIETRQASPVNENHRKRLVNLLHASLFEPSSYLLDEQTKVYQLMNYVNLDFLSHLLGVERGQEYLEVNVGEDMVEEGTENMRQSLLQWRWINNLKQVVHLGSRENLKVHGKQAEEFRAKLKDISLRKLDDGWNSIETRRADALAYLKKLEDRLLNRESEAEELESLEPHLDRYLQHPKLSIDLSGITRLANNLMPRPTVKRPLGAQKAANRWASLKTSLLHRPASNQTGGHRPQLVVNLQSATNVPLRITGRPAVQSRSLTPVVASLVPTPVSINSADFGSLNTTHLEPATSYVELAFQRCQVASSLARGRHPAWHETLFLPIQVPREAPAESSLADEYLQISLWDYCCQQEEVGADNSLSPTRVAQRLAATSQRVERHLLGSLKIPLSALISAGKIEGSFALEQDSMLDNHSLGLLERSPVDGSPMPVSPGPGDLRPQQATCVRLFITLDPPVAFESPHHLELDRSSIESSNLLQYALHWQNTFSGYTASTSGQQGARSQRTRARLHVRALVLLSDGKYSLISRLLKPLEPPPGLLDQVNEPQARMVALARYVSLLSPVKYGTFRRRALASTLWFDSRQLIDRCLGGPEERAALLCNYFLAQGKRCGLLLGDSIREGRCVHVIVWQDADTRATTLASELQLQAAQLFESMSQPATVPATSVDSSGGSPSGWVQLWNPVSGAHYASLAGSPLLSVGSIVTGDNVYANLQSPTSPSLINFNIRSRQHWFPLFESEFAGAGANLSPTAASFGLAKRLAAARAAKPVSWTKRCQALEQMRRLLGPVPLAPVAALELGPLEYQEPLSSGECQQLRDRIELEVKAHLLKWRPQRPTYFNRVLSRSIQQWLAEFEEEWARGQPPANWHLELARLIRSEPLSGFRVAGGRKLITCPLNVAFTGTKVLLDAVYASGVANADLTLRGPTRGHGGLHQTQFMVACHLQAYPGRVLSVWLYTAAIVSTGVGLQ